MQVITGAPLLKNANDVASFDAEQCLRNWTGLTENHIQDIKRYLLDHMHVVSVSTESVVSSHAVIENIVF